MRYAALLRGVNVGGRARVPMAKLKAVFTEFGVEDVTTYLQSGNAVFESEEDDVAILGSGLEQAIASAFGFDVPLVLVTASEIGAVVAENPYAAEAEADPTKVHVIFMDRFTTNWAAVDGAPYQPEEFSVGDRWLFMHLPAGSGRAKLPAFLERTADERVLTTRNWRTVLRLRDLMAN